MKQVSSTKSLVYMDNIWTRNASNIDKLFRALSRLDLKRFESVAVMMYKSFYNIARALVLSKSHWAIMNKIFMYARPCSIKWRVQFHFSCKIVVEFSVSSFCLSFDNVKIILNNPNPTTSLWVLPGKDVYFNVSILALFVSICMEYLYFVCLRFHYNLA